MLTQEELMQFISYHPDTGEFLWLVRQGKAQPGQRSGYVRKDGYLWIVVLGREYSAGRLAWFYMTGGWPTHTIDHKNRIKTDNRWSNLREATIKQQNVNRKFKGKIGLKGVRAVGSGRFQAQIWDGNRIRHIGTFSCSQEAAAAFEVEAKRLHGDFARAY